MPRIIDVPDEGTLMQPVTERVMTLNGLDPEPVLDPTDWGQDDDEVTEARRGTWGP